jgi:nucleotide-binding universal stress UspA family protein
MKKKSLTIAVLPFVKAHLLKTLLEKEGISCILEDLNLVEGTSSLAVRIQIREDNLDQAFPVLEEFLGKPINPLPPQMEGERQILVPVDFSVHSLKAAKIAFDIAKQLKVKMVLFHSYPNPVVYSVPFSDVYAFDTGLIVHLENAEKVAQNQMELFLKNLIRHFSKAKWDDVETEYIIKAGDARDDILSYAHQNQVMVIVMGTQGKADSEYDILGSVTAEIIVSTKVPILAVPAETPDDINASFKKVLYATNFDEKDFVAIEKLIRIIEPYHAQIFCVHVGHSEEPVWDLARLEGMKDILRSKYHNKTFECQLIIGENILDELQKFISENNIDVLALTTHKRSMLARMFNPSIARKMLFHSNIPLLVFHA